LSRWASKWILKIDYFLGRLKDCRRVVRCPFALELNSSLVDRLRPVPSKANLFGLKLSQSQVLNF